MLPLRLDETGKIAENEETNQTSTSHTDIKATDLLTPQQKEALDSAILSVSIDAAAGPLVDLWAVCLVEAIE